jgi:hypothetical protein
MKLLKQKQGAIILNLVGNNKLVLNWNNNMVELYNNGEKEFCIDLN